MGWASCFSLLEIVIQNDCLSCFIWVCKISLKLTLIQKGGLMTEFSVFMFLKHIAAGNSRLVGISLKDYKFIWKTKMRGMKTK